MRSDVARSSPRASTYAAPFILRGNEKESRTLTDYSPTINYENCPSEAHGEKISACLWKNRM